MISRPAYSRRNRKGRQRLDQASNKGNTWTKVLFFMKDIRLIVEACMISDAILSGSSLWLPSERRVHEGTQLGILVVLSFGGKVRTGGTVVVEVLWTRIVVHEGDHR